MKQLLSKKIKILDFGFNLDTQGNDYITATLRESVISSLRLCGKKSVFA